MTSGRPRSGKSGFTLVEVTLAILVVAVGLMAVFALFPTGLNLNKRAIDDTQAALFAEEVFGGLRAKVECSPDGWRRLTDPPVLYVGAPTVGMWWCPHYQATGYMLEDDPCFRITPASSGCRTNVYIQSGQSRVIDYAIRYRLETDEVDPVNHPRLKYARLYVWNGQYGRAIDSEAIQFYTEFYDYWAVP